MLEIYEDLNIRQEFITVLMQGYIESDKLHMN